MILHSFSLDHLIPDRHSERIREDEKRAMKDWAKVFFSFSATQTQTPRQSQDGVREKDNEDVRPFRPGRR